MILHIPEAFTKSINLSEQELLTDLATYLYDKEKLTLGQARKLAKLDQISFQKELKKRNIYLKYDTEDLKEDLENLAWDK
jgi:predicted HTH domain antitoxin